MSLRSPAFHLHLCALCLAALGSGCGQAGDLGAPIPADLPGDVDPVVLDWSGGISDLFPGQSYDPVDLGKFRLPGDASLADAADAFQAAVLAEVVAILDELPYAEVTIRNGRREAREDATVVLVTQGRSTTSGQIGQGDYDPCNVYRDDAAVIFGEELLRLGGPYTFEQWARIFANVIAHEIGHTVGYGHVARAPADTQRPLFVELMLATHTVPEMLQEQRYLADETNCPIESPTNTRMSRVNPVLRDACSIAAE